MMNYCYLNRIFLACLIFFPSNLMAQNFVLNGSFEDLTKVPMDLGYFYAEEWHRIGGTPDIYSNFAPSNTAAHPDWLYCQVKPLEGNAFAGIILEDKKENYREPIGTELLTHLREDSTYRLRISVAIPNLSSYRISSLEIVFSKYLLNDHEPVDLKDFPNHFSVPLDSVKDDFSWYTFSFEFQGKGDERYMSIGNFKPRKAYRLTPIPGRRGSYYNTIYTQAYLCIDNIELFDVALIEKPMAEDSTVPEASPEAFLPVTLKNLLFEVGSSELQNTEIPELDKIVTVLKTNEAVSIRITGHTDNSGSEEENSVLSLERAESVAYYLIKKGVEESRITTEGFGSQFPLSSNDTENGKAQNRRVIIEFQP